MLNLSIVLLLLTMIVGVINRILGRGYDRLIDSGLTHGAAGAWKVAGGVRSRVLDYRDKKVLARHNSMTQKGYTLKPFESWRYKRK